nr:MAG TPA: hypothetical protein [Caudoviricetes sp.]
MTYECPYTVMCIEKRGEPTNVGCEVLFLLTVKAKY